MRLPPLWPRAPLSAASDLPLWFSVLFTARTFSIDPSLRPSLASQSFPRNALSPQTFPARDAFGSQACSAFSALPFGDADLRSTDHTTAYLIPEPRGAGPCEMHPVRLAQASRPTSARASSLPPFGENTSERPPRTNDTGASNTSYTPDLTTANLGESTLKTALANIWWRDKYHLLYAAQAERPRQLCHACHVAL